VRHRDQKNANATRYKTATSSTVNHTALLPEGYYRVESLGGDCEIAILLQKVVSNQPKNQ
jgi:hypothetical protein